VKVEPARWSSQSQNRTFERRKGAAPNCRPLPKIVYIYILIIFIYNYSDGSILAVGCRILAGFKGAGFDVGSGPVQRGLVSHPKDWPWSSWAYYEKGEMGLIRIDSLYGEDQEQSQSQKPHP
jgi:hypothetical protein